MTDDRWSPEQYGRFRAERSAPFRDLLALVEPRGQMRCVDLGCGTGELTLELHERLQAHETLGIDSSPAMLARTEAHERPGLHFRQGTIERFARDGAGAEAGTSERFDLIFSNAALHWVADHETLLATLTAKLAPEGQLAVQVPANFDHPSHAVANEVAREPVFAAALVGWARSSPVLAPEVYARLLHRLGFVRQHVRLQVYAHLLGSRDDVISWVEGTLLTFYQARLPEALWPAFLARFRELLLPRLEDERPFLYPFKRILLWGVRGRTPPPAPSRGEGEKIDA